MLMNKNRLALAAAIALSLAVPSAFATNGYFAHGYGAKNKGMGGAGVALPQDSLAAATNPAGMVFVGNRYDLGVEMFSPIREYTVTGNGAGMNGTSVSDQTFFVIPSGGANWMIGSDAAVGVSMYGNGGMNTEYPVTTYASGAATAPTGVDLSQMFVNLSYARKITPDASVGGSLIYVYQRFKAYGLQTFSAFGVSSDPSNLTNNGYDASTGLGFKLGGQMQVPGNVTLGISYQPKIDMSEFSKYAGLFAEQGDFDIPSTYTLGAAWKVTPDLTLVADFQRINYTDVKAVSNTGATAAGGSANLGLANGPGFGWTDINVYKLGAQYTAGTWIWRAGWNHGDNPIPDNEVTFNILAPGVITDHITLGFTKMTTPTTEINFTLMHALSADTTGAFNPNFGGGTATIEMYQNSVELSLGTKF